MDASQTHGFDQEAAGRIYKLRIYLHDLHKTGLPLDFSMTGLQNLGSRFGMPVDAVQQQIAYVQAEVSRQDVFTEAQAADLLASAIDCDRLTTRESLERRLRLVGSPCPQRVIQYALTAGWLKGYGDQLELAYSCFEWLPPGVIASTSAKAPSILDAEFSVFPGPIKYRGQPPVPTTSTLRKLHVKITTSEKLRDLTEQLRRESDPKKQSAFKTTKLPYATFSGTFSGRTDSSLLAHSGLICLDLDHLGQDLERVRGSLVADPYVVMAFRSPRGDGLKVVFEVDPKRHTQAQWYFWLSRYLVLTHGCPERALDPSGSNVSRACFLTFDPECHLNLNP